MYKIRAVSVVRYPVIRVEFADGFAGDYDLTDMIAGGPAFQRLKDEAFFSTVGVSDHGRAFGWDLDRIGDELDFCADAVRIRLETKAVEELARDYRLSHAAAE